MTSRALSTHLKLAPLTVPEQPPVSGIVWAGVVTAAALFGGFSAWSLFAPLESAAIAPGLVRVENNKKTVQHLEGGIIREILVREGDVVQADQVLMRLDALDAEADRNSVSAQIDALAAQEARLIAQRDGLKAVAFPAEIAARRDEFLVSQILQGQERIFLDQHKALQAEVDVWRQRAEQYKAQIGSMEAQIAVTRQQLPLLEEEWKDIRILFEQGFAPKPRVLDLERRVLGAKGDIAATQSRVLSLHEQVREADVQMESLRAKQAKGVSEELREVQTRLSEARELLHKASARAGRREVLAPHEGVVMNVKYANAGGVIPPGGAILELIPLQEKLVLEVKVSPLDIDVVRPDLLAAVRFVAYKQRSTPTLDGKVIRVAPDAVLDERAGSSYFLTTVEVGTEQLARVPHVKLYPGMPVEVAIVTGKRTLFDYIAQPLTDGLERALRED